MQKNWFRNSVLIRLPQIQCSNSLSFFRDINATNSLFYAQNESTGLGGKFYIVRLPALQQQRHAKTRRNAIVNVQSKQKVTLDQRDASKQWA